MKSVEEICETCQKLPIRVELDLRYFLKNFKEKKGWDREYYDLISGYVKDHNLIEYSYNRFILTEKGVEVVERRWVAKRIILLMLPTIKDLLLGTFKRN